MNQSPDGHESIVLRVVWMLVFVLVWQVAQFLLGALVVVQLIYRLVYGAPNAGLMNFGDSLSQYLAQIGRFGMFHTDLKPWPFAEWPTPRAADGEAPHNPVRAVYPVREPGPVNVKPVVPTPGPVVKEPVVPAPVVEKPPVVEAAVVEEPTVEPLVVDEPEVKPVIDADGEAIAPAKPTAPVPPVSSVPPVVPAAPVPPAPPVSSPPPAKPDTPIDPLAPGAPSSPGPKL